MFQLFTGPYRALERALADDLFAEKEKDPLSPLLVLSPSAHLLEHLQHRLVSSERQASELRTASSSLARRSPLACPPSFLNVHFLTFYALAERVLAESGYTERVVTEPAFFKEAIRRILAAESGEEIDREIQKAFRLENRTIPRGLPAALAGTLKDLRDSGMRAKAALHAVQEGFLGAEAPEAAATLSLFARITGLLQKLRLRTSADLLRRAAAVAPSHTWIAQLRAIYLYGFYDLTGAQLDLVISLAQHPNVQVYFPFDEGKPEYTFAEKLLNDPAFMQKVAKRRSVIVDRRLSPATEIWTCSGHRDEVWLAAKEILRLTDEGMAFERIGVLARNLSPYLPALVDIFSTHRIPFVCSGNEQAGSHPLVKSVRTLLHLGQPSLDTQAALKDLTKSPYFRQIPSPKDSEVLSSWPGHIDWAQRLIKQSLRLPDNADDEETALFEAILELLAELRILDALSEPVMRQRFLETLDEKLDSLERPWPSLRHGGVQVLAVQRARGISFEALFVLGMNEKVFPRLIREDPFLSDSARSALAQATGCRLGCKLAGYEEERLLFELVREAATSRLYLLSQRSDEEGKALIPSVYLQELQRSLPNLKPARLPRALAEKFEIWSPTTWTPKELSLLLNRAALNPQPFYAALGWNTREFHWLLASHQALEALKPGVGPHDGLVRNAAALTATLQHGFSPTGLESLAECPFQYYAGHVLQLEVEEDFAPGGEPTPQALGTLIHRSLQLFYESNRDTKLPTDEAAMLARLDEAIEACFKESKEKLASVYPLSLQASKMLIRQYLCEFLKDDLKGCLTLGYRPIWFEQSLEGPVPQLGKGHLFHGKPDRIDVRKEAGSVQVRVVDYKSGRPKASTGRLETMLIRGKFLQLPIYLGLVKAFAKKRLGRKVEAVEAVLRSVRPTEEETVDKSLGSGFWKDPSAVILAENVHELIRLVGSGRFYIEPSTGEWGYCARCDFARICRKEHMPTRLRAERDFIRRRITEKLARKAPTP
jgi:ATP-dependent helicase/DNAse subunit B